MAHAKEGAPGDITTVPIYCAKSPYYLKAGDTVRVETDAVVHIENPVRYASTELLQM
jgi:hypothetical protein